MLCFYSLNLWLGGGGILYIKTEVLSADWLLNELKLPWTLLGIQRIEKEPRTEQAERADGVGQE